MLTDDEQYEVLTALALRLNDKYEDEGAFGIIEDHLPAFWQLAHFCCEEPDDDLGRKELEVAEWIRKSNQQHYKVFAFACSKDLGYGQENHIILGAESFEVVKSFLEKHLT